MDSQKIFCAFFDRLSVMQPLTNGVHYKNFHCMPDWTMKIISGNRKRFDETTRITITYKTGKKEVLANWENLKIISE